MKSKSSSQGSSGSSKSPPKISPKKSPARRTPIKLRATTEKCVAKRTRDKSPKQVSATGNKKTSASPSRAPKSSDNCKSPDSSKSKSPSRKKMEDGSKDTKTGDKKPGTVKAKHLVCSKKSVKAKVRQSETNQFIDLWAFVNLGKREASLNASLKVNIMYEKPTPVKSVKTSPKKTETGETDQDGTSNKDKAEGKEKQKDKAEKSCSSKNKVKGSSATKNSPKSKVDKAVFEGSASSKKPLDKGKVKTEKGKDKNSAGVARKRKSPAYKIFKEGPPSKCRKLDKGKSPSKFKGKSSKKSKKSVPSGHQLSNIIEKSPRQASLFAKAMIAMEQEEEAVQESAARTRIFDWMELRSFTQSEPRRIRWINGLQISSKEKEKDNSTVEEPQKPDESTVTDVDVSGQIEDDKKILESDSLHNTLLRTLHQIGDSRLLKEYLRAQKEDLKGSVDVEKCASPEKQKLASPEPKKIISPLPVDEKPEKSVEKSASCSPAKPQPCRVATPIPQFPVGQRANHMTSYIHHPIAQPVYPQQHHHAHPQPIKVTPYTPSPAYIYQYAVDRPQSGLYPSPSPSPISFGVGNNEISPRDYSSTFTLNHMGTLSLGRRGVNPYQPTAYNPSMHLPMQQIGFNFPAYFPASIQALPQQNMAPIQHLPIHQQYPLVQQPVITQQQMPQDVSQIGSYQPSYTQYPPVSSIGQNTSCMPPPPPPLPPPPAHSHRPTPMGPPPAPPSMRSSSVNQQSVTSVSPMESLRSMNPLGVQSITKSPALDFPPSSEHSHSGSHRQTSAVPPSSGRHHQSPAREPVIKGTSNSPTKYTVSFTGPNNAFSSLCKKEQEDVPEHHCDVLNRNPQGNNELQHRTSGSFRAISEGSDVSDLLHSAHTTMYQIDGMNSMENIREFHQTQASVTCNSTIGNSSPSKISIIGHASFNASYSVSSILDMPTHKVKSEPDHKNCGETPANVLGSMDKKLFEQSVNNNTAVVCFAASAGSSSQSNDKDPGNSSTNNVPQKTEESGESSKSQPLVSDTGKPANTKRKDIIVIEDTDESSDDEPLAKFVKVIKTGDDIETSVLESQVQDGQKIKESESKSVDQYSVPQTAKIIKHSDIIKCAIAKKLKAVSKKVSQNEKKAAKAVQGDAAKPKKSSTSKPQGTAKRAVLKPQHDNTCNGNPQSQDPLKEDVSKSQGGKDGKGKGATKKAAVSGNPKPKKPSKKAATATQPPCPLTPPRVSTNHGWSWLGEGQMKPVPKLTICREESVRIRKCYQSMQHTSGEIVSVRDCVILQSDGDGSIPYVARVSALWENINGEMMFSMLWYYQPEHTAKGREPEDGEQELFASKHREENSVACIDDKCYVLMYNEYCRLEAEAVRAEQGASLPRWREMMPGVSEEDQQLCRPPPPANTCVDNIWFCRYDYDIRKKMVKKPKHKKSNLRYRAPYVIA